MSSVGKVLDELLQEIDKEVNDLEGQNILNKSKYSDAVYDFKIIIKELRLKYTETKNDTSTVTNIY